MNSALEDAIEYCKQKIKVAKFHGEGQLDKKLLEKLDLIENFIETTVYCEEARKSSRDQINEVMSKAVAGEEPNSIVFNGVQQCFRAVRVNLLGGYLTAIWGLYDNLAHTIKAIYKHQETSMEGENLSELQSEDENKRSNRLHTDIFSALNYNGNCVPIAHIGPLRQEYRYHVALFYQIRNSFVHGAPLALKYHECFVGQSIADKFLITEELKSRLDSLCKSRSVLREGEINNKKVWTDSNQCLIETIDFLKDRVDTCTASLLKAVFHNLNVDMQS